jgi:hypothetical protein
LITKLHDLYVTESSLSASGLQNSILLKFVPFCCDELTVTFTRILPSNTAV